VNQKKRSFFAASLNFNMVFSLFWNNIPLQFHQRRGFFFFCCKVKIHKTKMCFDWRKWNEVSQYRGIGIRVSQSWRIGRLGANPWSGQISDPLICLNKNETWFAFFIYYVADNKSHILMVNLFSGVWAKKL